METINYYFAPKLIRDHPELQWIMISYDPNNPFFDPCVRLVEPEYAYMFPYWNAEA